MAPSGIDMRLTSEVFVAALMRTAQAKGLDCMLLRRGAAEAGAIFIITVDGDRHQSLYAPVPQVLADEGGGRRFERRLQKSDDMEITRFIESEARFDPDIFVVEITGRRDALSAIPAPHLADETYSQSL